MKCHVIALVAILGLVTTSQAGLVNHWTFDNADTSGLVANDTAGSFANNATWQDGGSAGLTLGATGVVGEAIELSGDNGGARHYVVANDGNGSIEINGATALSISMWIMPNLSQNDPATGIFTGRGSSINRGTTTFTNQFWGVGWEEFNGDDRRIRSDSTGATRSDALYDGSETNPEWFHMVFTWEGDGAVDPASVDDPTAVYVNGALDTAATVNADLYNSGSWIIGGDPLSEPERNYGGLLDDLAVFDMVLSPEQVAALYNGGLAGHNAAQVIPEPSAALITLMGLATAGAVTMRKRQG